MSSNAVSPLPAPSLEGCWKLWLTELPHHGGSEELTLLQNGDAKWEVQPPVGEVTLSSLKWSLDDRGCLLLTSQKGTLVSKCEEEIFEELLTLTPAHGFRTLFEQVAWEKELMRMDATEKSAAR